MTDVKCKRIIHVLVRISPREIEKKELCKEVNMLPRELSQLIKNRHFFKEVNIRVCEKSVFFSCGVDKKENTHV